MDVECIGHWGGSGIVAVNVGVEILGHVVVINGWCCHWRESVFWKLLIYWSLALLCFGYEGVISFEMER